MSTFTAQGTIASVAETEFVGKSQFLIRRVRVDIGTNDYPDIVEFEAKGKNSGAFDGFGAGDFVRIEFYINGREWQNRVYTSLSVIRVENAAGNADRAPATPATSDSAPADAPSARGNASPVHSSIGDELDASDRRMVETLKFAASNRCAEAEINDLPF